MLKIGDKVIRTPRTFSDPERDKHDPRYMPMTGTVVYIHPKGRYHTVEFVLPLGTVRESFMGVEE